MMMELVLAYYDQAIEALRQGADVQQLINLPVREPIGRYKYVREENLDAEYAKIMDALKNQIEEANGKGDF